MKKVNSILIGLLLFGAITGCATAPSGPGLDMRDFNKTVNPRVDFDEYVNGGWKRRHEIPAAYSSWGSFHEIEERNQKILRKIMEDAALDTGAPESSDRYKLGALWATGMDEARINTEGAKPLAADLKRIDNIKNTADLQAELYRMYSLGDGLPFGFGADQDFKNSSRIILNVGQGGLGLPDRDYYTKTDEESKAIRAKYVAHVAKMLQLAGTDAKAAETSAAAVLNFETQLAEASLTNVESRDPSNLYHLLPMQEVSKLTPHWDWTTFFTKVGVPQISEMNVAVPKFMTKFDEMLTSSSIADWKAYLRWHVVASAAPALSNDFVNERFNFYGKTLQGTKELQPRWKRMLQFTDAALGEALSREFVNVSFSPNAKKRAMEMIQNLISAFADRIKTRDWMSEETRKQALAKLHAITPKIGYPDKFRDYTKMKISRSASFYENMVEASKFEFQRNLNKLGKPVDRLEWGMLAHEVNAYYNPQKNEIAFPAGILQAPFFDERLDDAMNYGAMGAVIGHELTHGFDDEGSQFDKDGNFSMWWTPKDREEFERRATLVEKQFNEFVAIDDKTVNGKLTLGENIADLGGLTIAYHAYQRSLAGKAPVAAIDGFTGEQRFFLSWARGWRGLMRPEALKMMIQTNPHAPARFRVLGPLANMKEFAKAFGCKPGDPMVREESKRAEIW